MPNPPEPRGVEPTPKPASPQPPESLDDLASRLAAFLAGAPESSNEFGAFSLPPGFGPGPIPLHELLSALEQIAAQLGAPQAGFEPLSAQERMAAIARVASEGEPSFPGADPSHEAASALLAKLSARRPGEPAGIAPDRSPEPSGEGAGLAHAQMSEALARYRSGKPLGAPPSPPPPRA